MLSESRVYFAPTCGWVCAEEAVAGVVLHAHTRSVHVAVVRTPLRELAAEVNGVRTSDGPLGVDANHLTRTRTREPRGVSQDDLESVPVDALCFVALGDYLIIIRLPLDASRAWPVSLSGVFSERLVVEEHLTDVRTVSHEVAAVRHAGHRPTGRLGLVVIRAGSLACS